METAVIGQPEGAWSLEKLDFETSPFYPYGKESYQPMPDTHCGNGSVFALMVACRTRGVDGAYRITKAREIMDQRALEMSVDT